MADFLDDPAIKCKKHGKAFQAETCGECAVLVTLNIRIKLLDDMANAANIRDHDKFNQLAEEMEKQITVDELLNDEEDNRSI